MIKDCIIGENVKIPFPDLVNIYGVVIGDGTFIGPFVEITEGTIIGKDCRIQSHSFICGGVILGDRVFIGHGVMFTNDRYPKVNNKDWKLEKTHVGDDTCIGTNSTVLPVHIGKNVMIGAGTVVTKDVIDGVIIHNMQTRKER